jgi:eukaryotic-like serine/threonine-protein kinase
MAIQPGNHSGPYEILAAIGAGGMGEVYRARDTGLDRIVASRCFPCIWRTGPNCVVLLKD